MWVDICIGLSEGHDYGTNFILLRLFSCDKKLIVTRNLVRGLNRPPGGKDAKRGGRWKILQGG